MLTKLHTTRKLRPGEISSHVAHRAAQPEQWLMSTGQGLKNPPGSNCKHKDPAYAVPLTGCGIALAFSIVLASLSAASLIVKFLSQP